MLEVLYTDKQSILELEDMKSYIGGGVKRVLQRRETYHVRLQRIMALWAYFFPSGSGEYRIYAEGDRAYQ